MSPRKLLTAIATMTLTTGLGCELVLDIDKVTYHSDGGSGGGGTGGTGGTTTVPPECVPGVASSAVDDTCGVFVSAAGDDANDGTKVAPKKTFAAALAAANGAPVYACTDGIAEAITLTEDATIYGGLDCANGWSYVGLDSKTPWTAPANELPLRVGAGARASLYDLGISAADATEPGASSIAALAELGTQLTLVRCDVTAGNGADGAAGDEPMGTGTAGMDGSLGNGGCDSDMGEFGGTGGQLTCDAANVAGGDGGNGTKNMTGGDASDGKPDGLAGQGGKGQDVNITCNMGGMGSDGAPGLPGTPGGGAPMSTGTLSPAGYTGVTGGDGQPGFPGQGGGGGGGGKACMNTKAGPSGGGGGSGGCGGAGGKGGKPAGSSIALVSLGSKLTFDNVKLTAKSGGKGGPGGAGQPGGNGGNGGMPGPGDAAAAACSGGKGGDGGPGGKGGGGLGGHSLGLAHVGEVPDVAGATIKAGAAGDGGLGNGGSGNGAAGTAAPVQAF